MTDEKEFLNDEQAEIKVIGVGGGGGNAVKRMIEDGFKDVEFISVNTDYQALEDIESEHVLIGQKATKGLGAGANPDIGKKAAEENRDDIKEVLEGADMVYIASGMGGGTGTGAAPVVSRIAKELDILTIGIVTLPFDFEGNKRMRQALDGKKEFSKNVDTLITIPNDKILESLDEKTASEITLEEAFEMADSILSRATQGVTKLINTKGTINLDFADIRTVVKLGGSALMGIGEGKGDNAAEDAAKMAMTNPLLMHGMIGAKGAIMNFTTSKSYPFMKINKAAKIIKEQVDDEAEVMFGQVISDDEDWDEERVEVTLVATGFADEDTVFDIDPPNVQGKNQEEQPKAQEQSHLKAQDKSQDNELHIPKSEMNKQEPQQENRSFSSMKTMEQEFDDDLDIPSFLKSKRNNG